MSIERRVRKVEESLSMGERPIVCNLVWFGGEPVPPEQRRGNVIIRHVAYEAVQGPQEGRAGHEH